MKLTVLVGLIVVFSSCGYQKVAVKGEPNAAPGIVGGELVDEQVAMASGVVAVMNDEDGSICSGSLISSNVVLTAAHCVFGSKSHRIRIVFGINVDQLIHTSEPDILKEYVRTVKSAVVHPGYDPLLHNLQEWDWNDLALLRFKGAHPEEFKPAKLLTNASWLKVGSMVQMFGFGVSEIKAEDVDPSTVIDLEEAMEWGEIFCDDFEKLTGCKQVTSSGDGELRQTHAAILEIRNTEVVLDESHGKSSCSGDSGGPVYLEQSGELYLFGVTSRGGALCNDFGVYTNAASYMGWISENIESMKLGEH